MSCKYVTLLVTVQAEISNNCHDFVEHLQILDDTCIRQIEIPEAKFSVVALAVVEGKSDNNPSRWKYTEYWKIFHVKQQLRICFKLGDVWPVSAMT